MAVSQGFPNSLALFHRPPTDTAIEKRYWAEYKPSNQLSSVLEFSIPSSSSYIDLKQTRLHVKARLLNADGTTLGKVPAGTVAPKLRVAPVNNLLSSLWAQVDVFIQGRHVSPSTGNSYPYKAFWDIMLNYGGDAFNSQLQTQMLTADTNLDETDPYQGKNDGLNKRANITAESAPFVLAGPIYHDLFQQSRLLLNDVPLNLKFWPTSEKFRIIAFDKTKEYKIEIMDAHLKICHVKVSPEVVLAQNALLKTVPALYPYQRSDILTYAMPKGAFNYTIEDLYQGEVPNRVLVGIVSSEAVNGSFQKNGLHFENVNLNYIDLQVEGESRPQRALTPDYKRNDHLDCYLSLFSEKYMKDAGLNISYKDYKQNGFTWYLFDLKGERHSMLKRRGHTRLELRFAEGLKESYTLFVYSQADGLMKIDQTRNVYLE